MRSSIFLALIMVLVPGVARAGGFDYPSHGNTALTRGGAFVAAANDPTAIMFNPGAAARLPGTQIFIGGNLIVEDVRFQRRVYPVYGADSAVSVKPDRFPHDQTLRMPEVQNSDAPFMTPFVAVSTDLGFLAPYGLRLLAGFYGPHVHPKHTFPRYCVKGSNPCQPTDDPDPKNSVPSPARYDAQAVDVIVIYPTLGLAWEPIEGLRIGAVFQATYATLVFKTTVSASFSKSLDGQPTEDPAQDVDISADVEDAFTPTGIIGVHYSPWRFLELGASVRIGYEFEYEGEVTASGVSGLHTLVKPNPTTLRLGLAMPWVLRTGVRYIHHDKQDRELFDVELDFVYETTGDLELFTVESDGQILGKPIQGLSQPHHWQDTYSLRLGGTYYLRDLFKDGTLIFSAGGFWESEAVLEEYTRLDFLPFQRFGLAVGVGVEWGRYRFNVGYMHQFYESRSVMPDGGDARTGTCAETKGQSGCGSKVPLATPVNASFGGPIGNGSYDAAVDLFTVAASVRFGG